MAVMEVEVVEVEVEVVEVEVEVVEVEVEVEEAAPSTPRYTARLIRPVTNPRPPNGLFFTGAKYVP